MSRAKTFWELQKNLEWEEGEPGQDEQKNGRRRMPEPKTEKAPDTLVILYERFEKVSRGLGEIDQKFDKEFADLQDALQKAKEAPRLQRSLRFREETHRLSEDCEVAGDDLNEGLGCIRALVGELVGDTAAATSARSCGTKDRDNNELKYFQEALRLVGGLLCWEGRDDFEFVMAENSPSP